MPDRSGCTSARHDNAPALLRRWLDENEALLAGLVRLRELPGSDEAIAAVLAVREIRRTRLSWELWASLVEGEGGDSDRLLLARVPVALLDLARRAIWGDASLETPTSHLTVVTDT